MRNLGKFQNLPVKKLFMCDAKWQIFVSKIFQNVIIFKLIKLNHIYTILMCLEADIY